MFKKIIICLISTLIWTSGSVAETAKDFDLVILNGRVMDPESGHDGIKNIGIEDGKIITLSSEPLQGEHTIDAKGLVVAPGFIDLHHHGQDTVGYHLSAQDGVTTALELEEGAYPVSAWYQQRQGKAPINFGASVSHPMIRAAVKLKIPADSFVNHYKATEKKLYSQSSWLEDRADDNEIQQIQVLVEQGLDEGGLGIGFHLATTYGAEQQEILALFRLAAKQQLPNFVHIRHLGMMTPLESAQDIILTAAVAGASVQIVHLGSVGLWQTTEILKLIAAARAIGVDVTTEVYPYTAASTSIGSPHVSGEMLEKLDVPYSNIEWVATGERLSRETFAVYRQNQPEGAIIAHVMKEAHVEAAIADPSVMIASDAMHYEDGKAHPRSAGTFARVLGHYVRENNTLSLMEAIKKMTLLPAQRLQAVVPQMCHKGRIQPGADADITIFDPQTVKDRATFKEANLPSEGIIHVLVGGVSVVKNTSLINDVFPGQAIRR